MSGSGSYAVSRTHGGDRFYNPPAVRLKQQLLFHHQQQRQKTRPVKSEAENRVDSDGSDGSTTAALSKPPSVCSTSSPPRPPSLANVTHLDRFMESVTPSVQAQYFSEVKRSWRGQEPEMHFHYDLGDLWESCKEWSVYGVGVPLVLNGNDTIVQYYVPFLSGLQLYVDPVKSRSRCRRTGEESNAESSSETSSGGSSDCEADRRCCSQQNSISLQMNRLPLEEKSVTSSSSDEEAETGHSPGMLVFEYLEHEQPHSRKPLADKISVLASQFPELRKYKSCDLLPSSWISIAWYPIYRIPVGPTLKDLDASFLTFHSLSTNPKSNGQSRFHGAGGGKVPGGVNAASKVPLPVFGLASYKFKGSILSPSGPDECQQENSLLQAADSWLDNLHVVLPDYQFFLSHYSPWR